MSNVEGFTVEDGIGVNAIDSAPVNALGIAVRRALDEGFKLLQRTMRSGRSY